MQPRPTPSPPLRGASGASARSIAFAPSGEIVMPDPTAIRADARRAYEIGRLIAASRVAVVVIPLTALCARLTDAPGRCLVAGGGLLAAAVAVRWRQDRGVAIVDSGMATGIVPMVTAIVLCRIALSWSGGAAIAVCTAAGFTAGGLVGRVPPAGDFRTLPWMTASLIAGLTAALGCVGIGLGTAAGAAAGVVLGAVVTASLMPRPASGWRD